MIRGVTRYLPNERSSSGPLLSVLWNVRQRSIRRLLDENRDAYIRQTPALKILFHLGYWIHGINGPFPPTESRFCNLFSFERESRGLRGFGARLRILNGTPKSA